jgi:hypothetical protein
MENMNKKRPISSEGSPRSYVTRSKKRGLLQNGELDETEASFASVRNNGDLMMLLCSFFLAKDRVRLRQVDKQFYADKDLGQIVAVYGGNCVDIKEALEEVRRYVEFESTLDSMITHPPSMIRNAEDKCRMMRWMKEKLEQSWFDKKLGWDLNAIQDHADFGSALEQVLQLLAAMNAIQQENRKKLDNLTADVQKLCPLAAYNLLFDLMEKHGMKYYHFLHARRPPFRDQFSEHAYKTRDGYLEHLRPGRLFSYREEDGEMVETVLRECSKCNKVGENVWDESCDFEVCGTAISVCRDCTTYRTCFSCGMEGCSCKVEKCSAGDCQNYICRNVPDYREEYDSDDSGYYDIRNGPGCSFVWYAADADWDDEYDLMDYEQHLYCIAHKPVGAVKFDRCNNDDDE